MRIWHNHNDSWVRLTVADGAPVTIVSGGPHEEGYSYTETIYYVEDESLVNEWHTTSRDCDGRYDHFGERRARLYRVYPHSSLGMEPFIGVETEGCQDGDEYAPPDGLRIAWSDANTSQRDHTAEAAGY